MPIIHVAPTGLDSAPGSLEAPVRTLEQALRITRALEPGQPRHIGLLGGQYWDVKLTLTPADAGLTIEAIASQSATLTGGRLIRDWKEDGQGLVAADVPGVQEGTWDFRTLLVDGVYCPRARLPEQGKFRHDSVFNVRWMSSTKGGWERKPTPEELTTLKIRPSDLPRDVEPRNLELTLYHSWDESLVGVASIDHVTGLVKFTNPAGQPPGSFADWKEQARMYVAWNIRQGMTKPGQWYLDRARGKVVYWPLPGQDMTKAQVIAPTTPCVIRFEGTKEKPVRNITLRNLHIQATTTPLIAGGFGALNFDGAISGNHVENIKLESLDIRNVGGQGVNLSNATHLNITRCQVQSCGAGGIVFSGRGGVVTDNHVHHVGLTYPSALAVRCSGEDHEISHNHVHHTPYTAVNAGGTRVRVESNHFHHIMEELVDGAAVYMFAGKKCVIRGNYTHDVRDEQVHAYYLDEQSEDSLVEGNISEGAAWPLHMHMAKNCVIRQNICVNERDLQFSLGNCDSFVVERNILQAGGKLILSPSYTGISRLEGNVFYSKSGTINWSFHDRLPSLERNTTPVPILPVNINNVIADPKLVRKSAGVYEFAEGSPAPEHGITPLNLSGVGPR